MRDGLQQVYVTDSSAATRWVGGELAKQLVPGDIVFLEGELGAGKTTLVRGFLEALGHESPVRSPTFNLVQVFETEPPVLHADLYRLKDASSVGLEDYLETHVSLIEWPAATAGLIDPSEVWSVKFEFHEAGRKIVIHPPTK